MQLLFSQPLLTTSSAHLISLGLCAIYVGSLYLSKNARLQFSNGSAKGKLNEQDERGRDHPDVIRARLVAVSIATVVCLVIVFAGLWLHVGGTLQNLGVASGVTALRLGFRLDSLIPTLENVTPHLVTPVLFLGPLYASYLGQQLPGQRYWTWRTHIVDRFFTIIGIRTYWAAPITEELVFRSCVLAVYHLSGASRNRMIFLGPLTFGLAHIHHAWDTYNRYGRSSNAAKQAIFGSLFQFAYTTVFGFLVSYLFLRTGSILPPITSHIFCNTMGFPEIGWEMRRYPNYKKAIIVAYLLGIVCFVYTLAPWTRTSNNFYWTEDRDAKYNFPKY